MESEQCAVVERPYPGSNHFELRSDQLRQLLYKADVADLPVVVFSVAGAFRLGKSFFLGFCIRYLEQLEISGSASDWMGKDDVPLKGFSWKYGSERQTTGIVLWGRVFKVQTPRHGLVAVVLMDTEGSFDNVSTIEANVTIFSMSMLLSSVQVYNLSRQITQSDLEHLKLFVQYAVMARRDGWNTKEAFQKLIFLIRDWQYPDEKPFGLKGGQAMLDHWLESKPGLHPEVSELREDIRSSVNELECFLMPRPGDKVESKLFDGKLSDLSQDFTKHLAHIIPYLLSPERLVPKKLNGRIIKCKELVDMFQIYFKIFKERQLPKPMTVLNATAFVHNKRITDDIANTYHTKMKKVMEDDAAFRRDGDMDTEHNRLMAECLVTFDDAQKMGGNVSELREELIKVINDRYETMKQYHEMLQGVQKFLDRGIKGDIGQREYEEKIEKLKEESRRKDEEHLKNIAELHKIALTKVEKEDMGRNSEGITILGTVTQIINLISSLMKAAERIPDLVEMFQRVGQLIDRPKGK